MSQRDQDFQLAQEIVTTLVQKGIRLLAVDFDKTIINVHTAGHWRGVASELAEHVRESFKVFLRAALQCKNLDVCIVTHSTQPHLINELLKLALPSSDTSRVLIRGNSKDWTAEGFGLGKEQHIAWCTSVLYRDRHVIIQPHQILLMDDDEENVNVAIQFGHQGFLVPENVSLIDMKRHSDTMQVVRISPVEEMPPTLGL